MIPSAAVFYQTLYHFSELNISPSSITERFDGKTAAAAAARLPDLGPSPLARVQPQHEFIGTKAAFHHRHTADISFGRLPNLTGGVTLEPARPRSGARGVGQPWKKNMQSSQFLSDMMLPAERRQHLQSAHFHWDPISIGKWLSSSKPFSPC